MLICEKHKTIWKSNGSIVQWYIMYHYVRIISLCLHPKIIQKELIRSGLIGKKDVFIACFTSDLHFPSQILTCYIPKNETPNNFRKTNKCVAISFNNSGKKHVPEICATDLHIPMSSTKTWTTNLTNVEVWWAHISTKHHLKAFGGLSWGISKHTFQSIFSHLVIGTG